VKGEVVTGTLHRVGSGMLWTEVPDPTVDVFEAARMAAEVARFRALQRALPQLEREILCRHYGLGCERQTIREIATDLKVPRTTVSDAEQRALRRLRAAFGIDEAPEARRP
jgi:DNA-directed RNA polymerase sigma subunit (sigma70/sigma32)